MKKRTLILLLIILFIGAALRFWQLGKVPISPDWDEVALGYNAYSIIQTGKDEYGKFLPIVMRSFDDYKPALYSYLTVPSVIAFGLNIFAVRAVSAFFGVLTILAVYFLLRELFGEKNFKKEIKGFVIDIPLLSSFLLAISPWHIQFSRIAFESNVGLAFNVFTALFFLKGLKKPLYLSLSAVFAALSIYVYQSEKVFTPLLVLVLAVIFRKELLSISKKYLTAAVLIGVILILPMASYTLSDTNALGRAKGVSIFSSSDHILQENAKRLLIDRQNNNIAGLIVDNRRILFTREIIGGYLSHFDFNWLFIRGDIARHHAPNMGLMYLFELPFLLIGIYMLLFGPFNKKTKLFIFSWFLLAPLPASVTSGVPHAVRALNLLPMPQILTAIGLMWAMSKVSSIKYQVLSIKFKFILFFFIFSVFSFNFAYYLNQYFVQQNYFNAIEWQYGYEKMIPQVQEIEGNYEKIVVSNQAPMDQSYMFFLFYLKYPPHLYQQESGEASGGFREDHIFGKFEFRPINWERDRKMQNTLFVGRADDFPKDSGYIFSVYYPDGKVAMQLVEP
ncbi:MAG: glycosyltransferase family 39 protein [Candidatus Levyibacteriota bacterium]